MSVEGNGVGVDVRWCGWWWVVVVLYVGLAIGEGFVRGGWGGGGGVVVVCWCGGSGVVVV